MAFVSEQDNRFKHGPGIVVIALPLGGPIIISNRQASELLFGLVNTTFGLHLCQPSTSVHYTYTTTLHFTTLYYTTLTSHYTYTLTITYTTLHYCYSRSSNLLG